MSESKKRSPDNGGNNAGRRRYLPSCTSDRKGDEPSFSAANSVAKDLPKPMIAGIGDGSGVSTRCCATVQETRGGLRQHCLQAFPHFGKLAFPEQSWADTAATTDEAMESLLLAFGEIYDDTKDLITEIQSLQSKCNVEMKKQEALELSVDSLRSENERLAKFYAEFLGKLADTIELHANCQRLKEELKRVNNEHWHKENDYRNAMESIKKDHATRTEELESSIRCYEIQKVENEAEINHLHQNLASQRNQIEFLTGRLEEVCSDVESKYHYEIQGLKDCLLVEQEEKIELTKKVQNLEKELLISRTKLAENQLDLTSNQHAETLKQKIMKLRKENEVLKRRLHDLNRG